MWSIGKKEENLKIIIKLIIYATPNSNIYKIVKYFFISMKVNIVFTPLEVTKVKHNVIFSFCLDEFLPLDAATVTQKIILFLSVIPTKHLLL